MEGAILVNERRGPHAHDRDCSKRVLRIRRPDQIVCRSAEPSRAADAPIAGGQSHSREQYSRPREFGQHRTLLGWRPVLQHPHSKFSEDTKWKSEEADARFRPSASKGIKIACRATAISNRGTFIWAAQTQSVTVRNPQNYLNRKSLALPAI